ncbi:hypothetical protein, partial [Xanthomonas translucens]|uniref:hypothetical protein n=1 Tax=Xanthomonas campestris pv. translucens TaxID=343 RepID=UPI001C4010F6
MHPRTRSAQGARQGALSFGYFSLREQRKVTRQGRKPLLCCCFFAWAFAFCRSGFSRDWFCQESVATEAAPTRVPPLQEQEQKFSPMAS